jgi:hypothetical protein
LGLFHPQHLVSAWEEVLSKCSPIVFPDLDSIAQENILDILPPPHEKDPNFKKKTKKKAGARVQSDSEVARQMVSKAKKKEGPTQHLKYGKKAKRG